MTALRHVMILASAGSGKTFALTNRFVELLAAGAAPERIVALTFTRKAAGEFFDEILQKLAKAARDDAAAARLARDIGHPTLQRQDFLGLLRRMVDAMHRLRLGTLDSFFARVAQAFPLELGLAGEFEVLQEHAARVERRRVLRQMFMRRNGALDDAQAEFIEAFKRATFGAEEKQLGARLDAFLDQHQENFLAAPEPAAWGDPTRIWTAGSPWLDDRVPLTESIGNLRAHLGTLTDGQRVRWEAFFTGLAEWTPGSLLSPPVEYILKNALAVWPDLRAGHAEMTVDRRKLRLDEAACRALAEIVIHLIGAEIRRRLETTRGIFAVLRSYERHYHDAVRRVGRLTFSDVQRLLLPVTLTRDPAVLTDAGGPGGDGQFDLALNDAERAEERRLLLDYRLDAEIDHWLLDEFQDTSFGQWSVLRNLIDEVVQDPEGRRSFFCVGDVKQAIYAWREGDPTLFREIFNHYNATTGGAIEERHLVASWRSGPPLIEMVNTVFGNAAVLTALFPGAASTTWNREWRPHESAVPDRHGQAALLHADDEEGRWAATRALLDEIQPVRRGLTCAVLVKKNDVAAALAEYLRHGGIDAVAESDLHVATDNPLGAALLALVQAAAHPGDTVAQEHVAMSPLGAVLRVEGLGSRDALSAQVLAKIHRDGFERMVGHWVARLEPHLDPADAFSRRRGREFVAAAGLFDATGSRDPDEFIAFMERHTVRPSESAAVVRVMTIHKSKGLGFDVVVLPDLQGNRIDERRDGLAVRKTRDRAIDWVFDLPPKLFCAQDDVLSAYLRDAEAEACYESFSLLYVALTRAKRAMYVVTEPAGDSKSRNFPRLLADTLGENPHDVRVGGTPFTGSWADGDPDWHLAIEARPATTAERPLLTPCAVVPTDLKARRPSRRASGAAGRASAATTWFALESAAAAEFGTALHALLAEIEWLGDRTAADAERAWRGRDVPSAVIDAAIGALSAPALAHVWRRPAAAAEVWRERPFEIVLDDAWISGVFDRVVLVRTPGGRADHALVYDFKTDRVGANEADLGAAVARHRDQLLTYRRVVAVLTGLPLDKIEARVVFTAAASDVVVTP